jgi:hypothetical protein
MNTTRSNRESPFLETVSTIYIAEEDFFNRNVLDRIG